MRHTKEEVIMRTIREFELLDHLVSNLTDEDWERLVPRPETKEPWTVKDALAHITHWKADVIRAFKGQPKPPEERGLTINAGNNFVYVRWHARSPLEVLTWHRQVHQDVVAALKEAPEEWFSGRERRADWPFDLDAHSAYHRMKDIERALKKKG